MKKNPFKFGSIVDDAHFINREEELKKVKGVLNSENHLIILAPRRYGKSSLVFKSVSDSDRPVIALDLQLVTSPQDLASQLLKRLYRVYPMERIRQYIKHFRIVPSIGINPVNNEVSVSFHPGGGETEMFEDVLNLLESVSRKTKKLIVIFNEFQALADIDEKLFAKFRAIMQHHKKVNYVFLGSQESMIRSIFEKKSSPFYHFGLVLTLKRIPEEKFRSFLMKGFSRKLKDEQQAADGILSFTGCHPYYTQRLAYEVWDMARDGVKEEDIIRSAIDGLLENHDIDYARIWTNFNTTDKKLLIALADNASFSLSAEMLRTYSLGPSSTAYSSLKRLIASGYVIEAEDGEQIDDPFFKEWIRRSREGRNRC